MNSASVDPYKVNFEERAILKKWRDEGKITFSMSEPCTCTKEFWDWMNEILYKTYVPKLEIPTTSDFEDAVEEFFAEARGCKKG